MSVIINGADVILVHVRYDGRSYSIRTDDINIDGDMTRQTLQNTVENHLDIIIGALNDYEMDIIEETRTLIFRPAAKFGI